MWVSEVSTPVRRRFLSSYRGLSYEDKVAVPEYFFITRSLRYF